MTLHLPRLAFLSTLSVLALTGCPADDTPAETNDTTGDGDGDGDPGDGDGDPGDGDPGDGDPGDGDGDPGGGCGDGVLDDGEACDDGNMEDGDGCSSTCEISSCGLSWATTMDVPSGVAGGFDVEVGDDGSIYAAGIMIGPDDNDAWVGKWNPDGSVAWSTTFDSGLGNDGASGLALADDGIVYVVGWYEGDADDLWYAAVDANGDELWSQIFQSPTMGMMDPGDDRGTGIDIAPDGDIVIVGRVRVGDGDDDIWVRKAANSDGVEAWTSTWSDVGDENFSTDRGGPVSVADDGTIWVAARGHIDFDTQEATLLEFDDAGNFVSATKPQPGLNQTQDLIDVVADGDDVYFAFGKSDFPYRGWLYKYSSGAEAWSKTEQDWITIGEDWAIAGIGIDGAGNLGVAGTYTNEEEGQNLDWGEAWTAKLDGAGDIICRSSYRIDDGMIIPPSLNIDGAGFSASGFGLTGIETAGQGNATKLWTGFFLP